MNVLWVVLFLFVYVMIGLVFMGALDNEDVDGAIVFVLFWPAILAVLLLIGMFWLPVKLGVWIKKKIDKLL